MRTGIIVRIGAVIAGALTLTAALATWDARSTAAHQEESALRWARQMATQAEGMFLTARQEGERDPLGWTVALLAQGVEPRVMRVSRLKRESAETAESFHYDPSAQVLEYVKTLSSEDGGALRLEISQDYRGFLGAGSRIASDLRVALLFLIAAGLGAAATFGLPAWRATRKRPPRPALRLVIADWIRETKSLLTQMGVHIREMVRQANLLTQNAAQSRAQLGALRERIHAGLREMREARRAMRDGDQALIQAEVLALNLVIEAARVGGERGEAVAEMAERLQRLIQKASRVQSRNSAVLARLEAQTEPMATDADLAWHASEPVFQASQAMDEHIRKTTETLIGQAKLVQEVNKKLA